MINDVLFPRDAKKTLTVERRHNHYRNCRPDRRNRIETAFAPLSFLPPELWQYIFLCAATNEHPSTETAPLLLCRVCSVWRDIAISTPQLWRSITVVVTSFGKARPNINLVSLWLERSQTLPLLLSLSQNSNSTENLDIVGEVLSVFRAHSSRWQSLDLNLPGTDARWIGEALEVDTPILEEFRVRGYCASPGIGLFQRFSHPTPRLKCISVPWFPVNLLLRGAETIDIPWSQLVSLFVGSLTNLSDVFTILRECTRLQVCEFGIYDLDDTPSAQYSAVCHKNLRELQLHIPCHYFQEFLESTILPGLETLAVDEHGSGFKPEWPHSQFVDHMHRSGSHLKVLCLCSSDWSWSAHCIGFFNHPALQSLIKIVVKDESNCRPGSPLFRHLLQEMLEAHEYVASESGAPCVLPSLAVLEIKGCFSPEDILALLKMAKARRARKNQVAQLKVLNIECCHSLTFTEDYCKRIKRFRKGLKLQILPHHLIQYKSLR
ncbi:hypothetical protein DXG01_005079 [Tephrocybe rancida]|nr:hypothetical protein DXG01_005079 [Tephrocybe rancida]